MARRSKRGGRPKGRRRFVKRAIKDAHRTTRLHTNGDLLERAERPTRVRGPKQEYGKHRKPRLGDSYVVIESPDGRHN